MTAHNQRGGMRRLRGHLPIVRRGAAEGKRMPYVDGVGGRLMNERQSLVAAIAARPGDDDTRRVLADWLDDHGEHARADYIRATVEAAHTRPGTPRRAELLDRAADLVAANEDAWLGPWCERLIDW